MRPAARPLISGPAEVVVLALPASTLDRPPLLHLAAAADPWPRSLAVWRARPGSGFELLDTIGAPALLGVTVSELPAGPAWRWDTVSSLEVRLSRGGLASITREAALEGGNLLAVLDPDGGVELLSAARAELIGPSLYRLGDLLRGLGGTEERAGRALPAGATCLVLDEALRPLALSLDDLDRPMTLRIVPAGRDPSDPLAVRRVVTPAATALLPLAPVHPLATRTAEGIRLRWIRRVRAEGDGWSLREVPLGEEAELYELDILAGDAVRRSLASTCPSVLYPAAAEAEDFGAPQTSLSVALCQVSPVVGRGRPLQATLPIF